MAEASNKSPWTLPLLILAIVMNASGMASLVDSVYTWGSFFSDIVEVYRGVTTWLFSPLKIYFDIDVPIWLRDLSIVWAAFGGVGLTLILSVMDIEEDSDPLSLRDRIVVLFFWPLVVLMLLRPGTNWRDFGLWLLFSVSPLLLALFLDWQFMQHATA